MFANINLFKNYKNMLWGTFCFVVLIGFILQIIIDLYERVIKAPEARERNEERNEESKESEESEGCTEGKWN
ncbi:unnamed protein product [Blepharisma stoltei]|uniref:Uncharacterized protein n=1 Tax=Blepharisma stoltei TaxID=1481888 RepID=A0AAU9J3K7_9CILI|nr:unnamed protein product [Blepharisma stoltei]